MIEKIDSHHYVLYKNDEHGKRVKVATYTHDVDETSLTGISLTSHIGFGSPADSLRSVKAYAELLEFSRLSTGKR